MLLKILFLFVFLLFRQQLLVAFARVSIFMTKIFIYGVCIRKFISSFNLKLKICFLLGSFFPQRLFLCVIPFGFLWILSRYDDDKSSYIENSFLALLPHADF